ncbi:MAG TPA: hypothetical protein VKH81_10565 [Candidatus Angelobacter sp.]|nr:hypothetical protein [Candidatus Angelobacter sp.]
MAVSRRGFLHNGVLAAFACAASPLMALGSRRTIDGNGDANDDNNASFRKPPADSNRWQDHTAALMNMTREQFAGAVGTNFKVTLGEIAAPVWVTLLTVEDLPTLAPVNPASFAIAGPQSSTAAETTGFSLNFGSSATLQEGSYLFEHDKLGKFALFVVPDGSQAYLAVINRLSAPTIIAVPFRANTGPGSTVKIIAPNGVVTASPATSLAPENLSPEPSRIPGARRGALRD